MFSYIFHFRFFKYHLFYLELYNNNNNIILYYLKFGACVFLLGGYCSVERSQIKSQVVTTNITQNNT